MAEINRTTDRYINLKGSVINDIIIDTLPSVIRCHSRRIELLLAASKAAKIADSPATIARIKGLTLKDR